MISSMIFDVQLTVPQFNWPKLQTSTPYAPSFAYCVVSIDDYLGKKPCLFSLHNHFLSLNLCLPFLGCVQQTFQQIVQFHIAVKCGAIAFVCKVLNQFHDFSQLLNLLIISVTNLYRHKEKPF